MTWFYLSYLFAVRLRCLSSSCFSTLLIDDDHKLMLNCHFHPHNGVGAQFVEFKVDPAQLDLHFLRHISQVVPSPEGPLQFLPLPLHHPPLTRRSHL